MMKQKLSIKDAYTDKIRVFRDRAGAGKELAHMLAEYKNTDAIVLAIPSGGVPVAAEIAHFLNLAFDLLLVRKIQIPWNREAGFGAVNPDGEVILNHDLLTGINMSEHEVNREVQRTREVLARRNRLFRQDRPFPSVADKSVIIVDDGLASGYTMLSAVAFIRKRRPREIIIAVPTAFSTTVDRVLRDVEKLLCLNIRGGGTFAVADAYKNWYDLTDEEVLDILSKP